MCEIIKGFPNYEIHLSNGNDQPGVWSIKRKQYLKPQEIGLGYLRVILRPGQKSKLLHVLVAEHFIDNPDNLPTVDHIISKNKWDNRISNLRWSNRADQNHNRDCKGYTWCKRNKKWLAQIGVGGKNKNLGYFDKEEDARAAYLAASKLYYPGVKAVD